MTPQAGRFLDKARQCLADAVLYQPIVPCIAARGKAYELKSLSDYGTGAESTISAATATAAVTTPTRFVECIAKLLGEEQVG